MDEISWVVSEIEATQDTFTIKERYSGRHLIIYHTKGPNTQRQSFQVNWANKLSKGELKSKLDNKMAQASLIPAHN